MRYFSRTVILFGVLLLPFPAMASGAEGNGRIAGLIRDVSGSPLGNAIVKIFREVQQGEALLVARSNSRGFFRSGSLPAGTYYLQISRQGYQPVKTSKFVIDPGQTTSLSVVLQEFFGYISNEDDPRNWELNTVMRSTSDRRLIFRDLPELQADAEVKEAPFYRSGSMHIASNTALNGENYYAGPHASQSGVSSNFAITEPLTQHSRMILSGQLDFGRGAFWRLRNTYNYRPSSDHDYRLSVGYGQMNVNYPGSGSLSSQLLSQETGLRDTAVRTLAFGVEANTNFMDILAIKYGFDYSRLHYGESKGYFYPSIQILVRPAKGLSVQTSFTSRRLSDTNSVVLPDGEVLDLSEPTLITMVGNRISMRQINHSEISVEKELAQDTAFEIAVYQDRIHGPGLPVMVTTITPTERKSQVVEVNEDRSAQRGMRLSLKQQVSENLNASVSYVYGDAVSVSNAGGMLVSDDPLDLAGFLKQRNQHSITGRLDATIPVTKTRLLATMRWYPGNPITPVDWFSDRMDIGTKSANLELRQAIPIPEFMGTTGRWEIMVDLRNVLNQGREVLPTGDGEVVLNRNPRSLRFGLNLSFR